MKICLNTLCIVLYYQMWALCTQRLQKRAAHYRHLLGIYQYVVNAVSVWLQGPLQGGIHLTKYMCVSSVNQSSNTGRRNCTQTVFISLPYREFGC